jgi:hypothetical protein
VQRRAPQQEALKYRFIDKKVGAKITNVEYISSFCGRSITKITYNYTVEIK